MRAPDWQCLNQQAPWQARDSQGYEVFRDELWILGGWFTPKTANPRDVWHSPDGVNWACATAAAPWVHSDLPVTLVYQDRLWMMGGRKLPGAENSNAVWSSPDGVEWTLECAAAGWCSRVSAAHVVFKDRMWVLGGTENFYEDSARTLHNDVWSTTNGRDWTCVTEHAPWAARAHHRALVFADKIWVLGGGARFPEVRTHNDVWCSEDGEHWTEVTSEAPWAPRLWHSAVVHRDRMWIMAGVDQTVTNLGDVWFSANGRDWSRIESDRIWSPRHAQAAFSHRDQIILAAGHARPVNNEVWSLQLPDDFFADGTA